MTQPSVSTKVELSAQRFGGAEVASIFVTFPSTGVSVQELLMFNPQTLTLESNLDNESHLNLVCDGGAISVLRPDNGDMLNFVRVLNKEGIFSLTMHVHDPKSDKLVFRVIMAEIGKGRILSDTGARPVTKETLHMHVQERDKNHDAYAGKVFTPVDLAREMDNRERFDEAVKLDPSQAN